MTTTAHPLNDVEVLAWTARGTAELLADQLAGIASWNRQHRPLELADDDTAASLSREMRLDVSRHREVVRRTHDALVAHTQQQLEASAAQLPAAPAPRAVLAHRNAWFRDKVRDTLLGAGVDVVVLLDNGADAIGVCVAEQPDLLLVEDKLAMAHGVQVVREVLQHAPRTIAVAQVSYEDEVPELLAAGARTAFPRRVPPVEVGRELAALVGR